MHGNALRLPLTSASSPPSASHHFPSTKRPASHHFPSTKSLLKTTGWGLTKCLQQTGEEGEGARVGRGAALRGRASGARVGRLGGGVG